MRARVALAGVAVAWLASLPSTARADSKAVAEALFRDATQLLESGNLSEACPKFADSQKIDPALGTLLYLAVCHEKQGRTASAWSEFSSAKEWADRILQHERAAFAQKHASALEAKLFYVIITAPALPGLELRVDDGLLTAAATGTPLPLDPGDHTIAARAPGYQDWRTKLTVPSEPGKTTVTVPELKPVPVAVRPPPPAPVASAPPAAVEPVEPSPPPGPSWSRVAMWSSVAVGAAGLGVGSIFGLLTFNERDSAKNACPNNVCSAAGINDINSARTDATLSTVGFGVGLAGAAAAVYFAIRGDGAPAHAPSSARPSLTVTPGAGGQTAGLSLSGQFE